MEQESRQDLSTLAALYKIRFERVSKSADDLTCAIEIYEDAINKSSPGNPDLPSILHNLSITMTEKYNQTNNPEDLDRAIEKANEAVNSVKEGHPDRALYLNNLGRNSLIRFLRFNKPEDLDNAYLAKKESLSLVLAAPYVRVTGCLAVAWALVESRKDFNGAADLIEPAIWLFTTITPRIQSRRDQEYLISEFSGLPGTAASILLNGAKTLGSIATFGNGTGTHCKHTVGSTVRYHGT